jgi:hypothetical protein
MKPTPSTFTIDLVDAGDPQARHGLPARDGAYRLRLALKSLLRGFGLRCTAARPGTSDSAPTPNNPPTEVPTA